MLPRTALEGLAVIAVICLAGSGPASGGVRAQTPGPTPATAQTTVETLFETIWPGDTLPSGPALDFILWHATIAPGVRVTFPPEYGACCPGPLIVHVLEGELALRVEGALQVARAGSAGAAAEDVPPDTEVVLQPGATAGFRFELPATFANPGETAVHLVSGGLFAAYAPGPIAGYEIPEFVELFPAPPLPPGPVTMALVRATLPPDGVVAAAPVGALRLALRGSGAGILVRNDDGSLANIGREPVIVYVLTLFPRAGAGTLMP